MRFLLIIAALVAAIVLFRWFAHAPNSAVRDTYIEGAVDEVEMRPGETPKLEAKEFDPDIITEEQAEDNPDVDVVLDEDEAVLDGDIADDESAESGID